MKENTALWKFGAVALLLLTSCSKPIEEAPSFSPSLDDTSEIISEAEPESHRASDSVMLTTTVKSAYVNPTATLANPRTEGDTIYMDPDGDNASSVGLDTSIFTVNAGKGEASNCPGLNSSRRILLYAKRTNGNGSYFDVSIKGDRWINAIAVTFTSNPDCATVFGPSGDPVEEKDGSYVIDGTTFRIKNTQSEGASAKIVQLSQVVITYEGAAEDVVKDMDTMLSLSYNYEKDESGESDFIDKAATGRSTYGDWTKTDYSSNIDYAGNNSGGNNSIQLRSGSSSGIVNTNNPDNQEIHQITITWTSLEDNVDKTIDIYGKNTAYAGASDLYNNSTRGTLITSFTYDSENLTNNYVFTAAYKFIGIRSSGNTLYISSITIDWDTYDYSDTAVRFGSLIRKSLWDRLDDESDIAGYGVFLSTATYLGGDSIEDKYDAALTESTIDGAITAITDGNNIKNFYTSVASKANPDAATNEQKGELTGDYYIWNLYKSVSTANLKTSYTAAAYIRVSGKIIFINEHSTSIKALAAGLVASDAYDESSFDGSLNNLANLA